MKIETVIFKNLTHDEQLIKFAKSSPHIKKIIIKNIHLSVELLRFLIKTFSKLESITIEKCTVESFPETRGVNYNLIKIKLENNNISEAKNLIEFLKHLDTLKKLSITDKKPDIPSKVAQAYLKKN